MVEHLSTRKKQDGNQRNRGPEIPVLDDRQDVGGCHCKKTDASEDGCDGDGDLQIVDRTDESWMRNTRELTRDP